MTQNYLNTKREKLLYILLWRKHTKHTIKIWLIRKSVMIKSKRIYSIRVKQTEYLSRTEQETRFPSSNSLSIIFSFTLYPTKSTQNPRLTLPVLEKLDRFERETKSSDGDKHIIKPALQTISVIKHFHIGPHKRASFMGATCFVWLRFHIKP